MPLEVSGDRWDDDIRVVVEKFHADYMVRTFIVDHLQLAKSGTTVSRNSSRSLAKNASSVRMLQKARATSGRVAANAKTPERRSSRASSRIGVPIHRPPKLL